MRSSHLGFFFGGRWVGEVRDGNMTGLVISEIAALTWEGGHESI